MHKRPAIKGEQLKRIKMLAIDVDGVLTDGGLYFDKHGQVLKRFHVLDGMGLVLLKKSGVKVVLISGQQMGAVMSRAEEIGIDDVLLGMEDKGVALQALCEKYDLAFEDIAYIGDDINDIPILERVGWAVGVRNAINEVKNIVDYVTRNRGGEGAVREICDMLLQAKRESNLIAIGVIPARYGSTRFEGKVLASIAGYPMVYHVYRRALQARLLQEVIVATDDERVVDVLDPLDVNVVMTSPEHMSGTDRVAEVAERLVADVIINIQGDEPLIDPKVINAIVSSLAQDTSVNMSTAVKRIEDEDQIANPNIVKTVLDKDGYALYFSRSPIPFFRNGPVQWAYKHIGIYGYRRNFLLKFADLSPGPLEQAEHLEQLRALENGFRIKAVKVLYDSIGIDIPEDLMKVREIVRKEI